MDIRTSTRNLLPHIRECRMVVVVQDILISPIPMRQENLDRVAPPHPWGYVPRPLIIDRNSDSIKSSLRTMFYPMHTYL